jgi:chromosome partitioning protein
LDTAAAITVYSLNALVASRYVIIPVTPEYQPIVGAEQTFKTATMVQTRLNPDLDPPLFLFTQVDARKSAHHRYRQYLRKRYSDQVVKNVIRTSAALAISYSNGTTVFENDPYSRGARDYANATDELVRRVGLGATAPATVASQDEVAPLQPVIQPMQP